MESVYFKHLDPGGGAVWGGVEPLEGAALMEEAGVRAVLGVFIALPTSCYSRYSLSLSLSLPPLSFSLSPLSLSFLYVSISM